MTDASSIDDEELPSSLVFKIQVFFTEKVVNDKGEGENRRCCLCSRLMSDGGGGGSVGGGQGWRGRDERRGSESEGSWSLDIKCQSQKTEI